MNNKLAKNEEGRTIKGTFFFFRATYVFCEVDRCMPSMARASVGGMCYVINRGNAQNEVFRKDGDYRAFVELIGLACERIPMRKGFPCQTCLSLLTIMQHAESQ